MIDSRTIKKSVFTILKEKGFVRTAKSSLFVRDCGYYFILFELVPAKGWGYCINVGVNFMWGDDIPSIVYDYSDGDIRINVEGNGFGALLYDSDLFDTELNQVMTDALEKIFEYQELSNFHVFKHKIETRRDFVVIANEGYEKRDICLAIAKMFSNETEKALEILKNASINSPVARNLLESSSSIEEFNKALIYIINNGRNQMEARLKISFPPISFIWEKIQNK